MYAIVVQGEIIAMQDSPRYVKINPETGVNVECIREEAQGIAANGIAYNIRGGTTFNTPEAEAKEIESGEVMIQTENNRKALNVMIGVNETEIPLEEELSYADKLMHSYTNSEADAKALNDIRNSLDNLIVKIVNEPAEINTNLIAIRPWEPGAYAIGDVRMFEDNPYKCVQAHDSTGNLDWNPIVASLWMQYHGTSKETARPWIQPTGAHDMYKENEYMIWEDKIYHCISDTTYSPNEYAANWEVVE